MRRFGSPGSRLGSRLRISELETHDTGYYTCEALSSGGKHRVQSTGVLVVKIGRWGESSECIICLKLGKITIFIIYKSILLEFVF